jgi:hypothetical protein
MGSMIHYEEDAFLLKDMLKTLRRGCSIDIDPSIFIEYTVNQLLFISKALKELYSSIQKSNFIHSPEKLRSLIRVSGSFTNLIDDILNDRLKFSENLRNYSEDFKTIKKEHMESSAQLKELLGSINSEDEQEQLVSEEEFMFLFRHDEEEE